MSDAPAQVLRRHSKSFALAARLLPRATRADAQVLYAWCRRADDAIDSDGDAAVRRARLIALRAELASVYRGVPQTDALLSAFQELVFRRKIPNQYPSALLDGLETDLGIVRVATMAELLLYSYRVAGVVGLMMCHVLGVRDTLALRRAAHLGIAMQLTNICRDVAEDAARQRSYIPADLLNECGHSVSVSVQRLLELGEHYYRSGDRGLPALGARAAFAVRTARLVYSAIAREIARRNFDVTQGRAVVPAWRKCMLLLRAAVAELTARAWPLRATVRRPLGGSHERAIPLES